MSGGKKKGGVKAPPDFLQSIAERIDRDNHELRESMRRGIFRDALETWRAGHNPIDALEAIAAWDQREPLPADLAGWLGKCAGSFVLAFQDQASFSQRSWKITDAEKVFLKSFELESGKRKGANPFAQHREAALSYKAARAYLENITANPMMKSTDIVREMAKRAGIAEAQMHRYIKKGRDRQGWKSRVANVTHRELSDSPHENDKK
ncbi:MAG: hypothetical protein M0Z28_15730 [Rhodospirillales bacterium]|nr:hypothetical protein [Rhodospirillales bacterium]